MTKFLKYIGLCLIAIGMVSLPVYATVKSNDTIIVSESEVIDDDFFATGDSITIEGTVNGDVYAAGNRITIRGTVNGDVIAAGGTIEVTGVVRDDLRAAGNSISLIGAEIGDSVSVGGNELVVDNESVIAGGVVFGGRSLQLDGKIGRGVTGGSDDARIDNQVGRTVRIAANSITIDESAVIDGNLEYRSDTEAVIKGQIRGETIRSQEALHVDTAEFMRWFVIGFNAWAFVGAIIVAGVLMLLFPRMFDKSYKNLKAQPLKIVGIGAIATLITIPLVVLLFVSVFGIPLAVVLVVIWLLAIYFAKFFVGYAIGVSLLNPDAKSRSFKLYLALVFGLFVYYVLRLLPGFGWIIRFATVVLGIGMMLSLYVRNNPQKQKR